MSTVLEFRISLVILTNHIILYSAKKCIPITLHFPKCLFAHSVCANFSLIAHSVCANFGLIAHSPVYSVILLK